MIHNLENKKSISRKKNVGGTETYQIIPLGLVVSIFILFLYRLIVNWKYITDMDVEQYLPGILPPNTTSRLWRALKTTIPIPSILNNNNVSTSENKDIENYILITEWKK